MLVSASLKTSKAVALGAYPFTGNMLAEQYKFIRALYKLENGDYKHVVFWICITHKYQGVVTGYYFKAILIEKE